MFGDSLMSGSCVTGHSPYWREHHNEPFDDCDEHDDDDWDDDDDDDWDF